MASSTRYTPTSHPSSGRTVTRLTFSSSAATSRPSGTTATCSAWPSPTNTESWEDSPSRWASARSRSVSGDLGLSRRRVAQILHRRRKGSYLDACHWREPRGVQLLLGAVSPVPHLSSGSPPERKCRYHGGWLAPNIYFLGHAGCVQVNGVRIAGASGIFKSQDFRQGVFPLCGSRIRRLECFTQATGSEFPTTTAP